MTVGRWVLKFTLTGMVFWLFVILLIGFGLGFPMRRLSIPWLLMSIASLAMAVFAYWARSPVDQPPSAHAPRRFAVLMLALVNIECSAILWSTVLLGVISRESAISDYMPLFLPLSVVLPIGTYYLVRRKVRAV
jgi:hypothetical protein